MSADAWAWGALAGLGAFHGVNPGMGWLFAVALGLQERDRRAVLRALGPIAAGHALAVLAALALVEAGLTVVSPRTVALVGAACLVGFGCYRLTVRRHPRWVGLRLRGHELVLWSFLMASAHGAGLMLLPVALGLHGEAAASAHPVMGLASGVLAGAGHAGTLTLAVAAVHTAAMVAVMGAVAVLVYQRLGLKVLRGAWVNLDLVWGGALVVAGVFTLFT